MNWLENKYTLLLSGRLRNFKIKNNRPNFSCPICNDSKKNTRKARGWILEGKGQSRYFCHNCGISLNFEQFLKRLDLVLYYDYVKDKLLESGVKEQDLILPKFDKPIFKPKKINLKKISQLSPNHPAKVYVQSRGIPSKHHYKLFYAPKFGQWVNSLDSSKFEDLEFDEPRLVFPLLDEGGIFFGLQGRSFRPNALNKYITILLDEDKPKLFGLDTVDKTKKIYILEGPIDSLFIPNALACCGGKLEYTNKDCVLIYDNEPRSKHTIRKMETAISEGYKICIWPEDILQKDINDMALAGLNPKRIIDQNTYQGLDAELKLAMWKKI